MFPCRVRLFNLAYFCSSNLRSNGDICVPIIFRKYCSKLPANETEKIPTADRYRYTPKNSYNTTQQFQCSSNIQPLRLKPNSNETALELKYRTVYEETWRWLDEYWSSYNLSYLKAKNAYLEEKKKISMEEHKADPCERKVTDLGAFHREFLADNKKRRINFNVCNYA
ncbi:unnamed protein product [Heterobilharzia americana]|nr:unnamed protein product [Heterobilharzia americana]CAH8507849.1 unnamed protein product [Heterobilharzia americana]